MFGNPLGWGLYEHMPKPRLEKKEKADGFYVMGNHNKAHKPRFVHRKLRDAKKEAIRLASNNPGKSFTILRIHSSYTAVME